MPIRAEERDRYPADWPAIARAIRERAGNKCERCGVMNGANIRRGVTDDGVAVWRCNSWSVHMDGMSAEDGSHVPDSDEDVVGYGKIVRVVLTVAHLNHKPEDCRPENLRAWCQRCHLRYDREHHQQTRRSRRAIGDLFEAREAHGGD